MHRFKKNFFKYLVLLISIGLSCFYACTADSSEFELNDDFVYDESAVYYIDTLSLEVNTVRFDSLETGNTNKLLVGRFKDPMMGDCDFVSRFHLGKPVSSMPLKPFDPGTSGSGEVEAELDSVIMRIYLDGYTYGDTTKMQSLSVYALDQYNRPNDYNTAKQQFWNVDPINVVKDKTLGVEVDGKMEYFGGNLMPNGKDTCFYAQPNQRPQVRLKLDKNNIGKYILYQMMKEDDYEFTFDNDERFLEEILYGFVVVPGEKSEQLSRFNAAPIESEQPNPSGGGNTSSVPSPKLVVFLGGGQHGTGVPDSITLDLIRPEHQQIFMGPQKYWEIPEGTKWERTHNGVATPFKDIDNIEDLTINSSKSNSQTFIQGTSGVYTEFRFSRFDQFKDIGDGTITDAVLVFHLEPHSWGDFRLIPPSLDCFINNDLKDKVGQMYDQSGQNVVSAIPQLNPTDPDDIIYKVDITAFVKDMFITGRENLRGVGFSLPLEDQKTTGTILNIKVDDENRYRTELQMHYTKVEK